MPCQLSHFSSMSCTIVLSLHFSIFPVIKMQLFTIHIVVTCYEPNWRNRMKVVLRLVRVHSTVHICTMIEEFPQITAHAYLSENGNFYYWLNDLYSLFYMTKEYKHVYWRVHTYEECIGIRGCKHNIWCTNINLFIIFNKQNICSSFYRTYSFFQCTLRILYPKHIHCCKSNSINCECRHFEQ